MSLIVLRQKKKKRKEILIYLNSLFVKIALNLRRHIPDSIIHLVAVDFR